MTVLIFLGVGLLDVNSAGAVICDWNKMGAALRGVVNRLGGGQSYDAIPHHEIADTHGVAAGSQAGVFPYSPIQIGDRVPPPIQFAGIAPHQDVFLRGLNGETVFGNVVGYDVAGNPIVDSHRGRRVLNRNLIDLASVAPVREGTRLTITHRDARGNVLVSPGVYMGMHNGAFLMQNLDHAARGNGEDFAVISMGQRIPAESVMTVELGFADASAQTAVLPQLELHTPAARPAPPVAPLVFVDEAHLHPVENRGDETIVSPPPTAAAATASPPIPQEIPTWPGNIEILQHVTAHNISAHRADGTNFNLVAGTHVDVRGNDGVPHPYRYVGFHSDGRVAMQDLSNGRIDLLVPSVIRSVDPRPQVARAEAPDGDNVGFFHAGTLTRVNLEDATNSRRQRAPASSSPTPAVVTAQPSAGPAAPTRASLQDDITSGRLADLEDWHTPQGNSMWGRRVRFRDAQNRNRVYDGYISLLPPTESDPHPRIAILNEPPNDSTVMERTLSQIPRTVALNNATISPANIDLNGFYVYPNSEPVYHAPPPGQTLMNLSNTPFEINSLLRAVHGRGLTPQDVDTDAVYNTHHAVRPIPPEIATQVRGARDVARYFRVSVLNAMTPLPSARPGDTFVHGTIGGAQVGNYQGWYRIVFHDEPHDRAYKVYLPVSVAQIPGHLVHFVRSARNHRALQFKFGRNLRNLQRPDRIVVHFANAQAAADFAREMANYCEQNQLTGDRVPLTHPVGRQGLISMGIDSDHSSWRQIASRVVAEGVRSCESLTSPGCITRVLDYMRRHNLSPSDWLPMDRHGNEVRRALGEPTI